MTLYRVTRASTALSIYEVEANSEAEAIQIASASGPGMIVSSSDLWSSVNIQPVPAPIRVLPQGFGTYLRRISGGEAEARAALARCQQAGMKWISLMVEATDGWVVPLSVTEIYAKVFREAGYQIFVWTLPGNTRSESVEASVAAGELVLGYAEDVRAAGIMLDIEAAYKDKPEELHALVTTVANGRSPTQSLGVVSYPIPSYHKDLAWSEFKVCDWGSPMFYETAGNITLVNKGLAEWSEIVSVLAPSLDGWSGTGAAGAERLKQDIIRVCGTVPTVRVDASAIWSEQQMDDPKRFIVLEMGIAYNWV